MGQDLCPMANLLLEGGSWLEEGGTWSFAGQSLTPAPCLIPHSASCCQAINKASSAWSQQTMG